MIPIFFLSRSNSKILKMFYITCRKFNRHLWSFRCQCHQGWTGDKCQLDVDECQGNNPCKNGGICTNLRGNYTCDCSNTEYRGRQCEEVLNRCSDGPCQNGGVCTSHLTSLHREGYHCECSSGYTGKNCQFNEGRENDPFTASFNIQVFK